MSSGSWVQDFFLSINVRRYTFWYYFFRFYHIYEAAYSKLKAFFTHKWATLGSIIVIWFSKIVIGLDKNKKPQIKQNCMIVKTLTHRQGVKHMAHRRENTWHNVSHFSHANHKSWHGVSRKKLRVMYINILYNPVRNNSSHVSPLQREYTPLQRSRHSLTLTQLFYLRNWRRCYTDLTSYKNFIQ